MPARDFAGVSAWEVVEAIRADGEDQSFDVTRLPLAGPAGTLVESYEQAMAGPLRTLSLRDLGDPESAAASATPTIGSARRQA